MSPLANRDQLYSQAKSAHESGNHELGARLFAEMLRAEPRNTVLLLGLASCLIKLFRFEMAMKHLQKAVKLKPMMPELHCAMGSIEKTVLNDQAAIKHYERALAIKKDYPPAIYGMSDIYRKLGRFEDATAMISGAIERSATIDPHLADAFAVVASKADRELDAINYITKALETDVPDITRLSLLFRLAGVQDQLKDHEQAWETLCQANAIKRTRWDPDKYTWQVDQMLKFWTRKRLASLPISGENSEEPVFVVGMPRSGTSLIEQIISAHPQGAGAGEVNEMSIIASKFQGLKQPQAIVFLDDVNRLRKDAMWRAAKHYLGAIRKLSEHLGDSVEPLRIVDKLPYNYQVLPLIQLLFPKAKIIHTVRDPRDVCISCFFQDFLGALGYAYDLDHLARYYADHDRIMAHMKRELDLPILEVQYEELVADPEPGIRVILDHIDLEFADECLEFHASSRAVHTASLEQVRQPMYTSSSRRWERYGDSIKPLLSALTRAGVAFPDCA